MDKQVVVKCESVVTDKDFEDAEPDLVIALGGDRTFLGAAGVIPDDSVPLLGIKTLSASIGHLQYNEIDAKKRDKQIPLILEGLDDESVTSTYRRSRALFESTHQARKSKMNMEELDHCERALVLNEVFTAEKDVAGASRYRIRQDAIDMGVFKSSGLIISTGTGSTGWLFSSRQITPAKIDSLAKMMGQGEINYVVNAEIANKLSNETKFPVDQDRLYYHVREGFSTSKIGEGYATEIKVISEMLNGEAIIDGHKMFELSIGDQFYVTADPKYALKCLVVDL